MPEPARGQSPRHLLHTITKITDAKFCVPAQPILSEGQSPGLVPVITTEDPLNGYLLTMSMADYARNRFEVMPMYFNRHLKIAVDTDKLIEFLKGCSRDARLLVRDMSVKASCLSSADRSLKNMTLLYYSEDETVCSKRARAEVMMWIRSLAGSPGAGVCFVRMKGRRIACSKGLLHKRHVSR